MRQIKKVNTLQNLMELDLQEHEIKRLAICFMDAVNDWPGEDKTLVKTCVANFKTYFGNPLTLEAIKLQSFKGQNAWHLEAGKSLSKILTRAQHHFSIYDFDEVMEKILAFYNCEFETVDFVAELNFFRTNNGGITSFVPSGYKPMLRFMGKPELMLCEQTYIGKDAVFAGERINAKIKLFKTEDLFSSITQGMTFEFCNVKSTIGIGTIKQVINCDLKQDNWIDTLVKRGAFVI